MLNPDNASTDSNISINVPDFLQNFTTPSYSGGSLGLQHYWIDRGGTLPVSLLGIVGNLVSLAVWSNHPTYSAAIFLFKYLAVWDTVFLASFVTCILHRRIHRHLWVTLILPVSDTRNELVKAVTFMFSVARLVSVHTSLMIAVCHCIAVYKPVRVHNGSLLSRCQVIAGCFIDFVLCLVIVSVFYLVALLPSENLFHILITINTISLSVPVLLLVVSNVFLLRKLRSPSQSTSATQGARRSNQRLTLVVALMSLCTVLTYPAGEVGKVIYMNIFLNDKIVRPPLLKALSGLALLQSINSSINVFFYSAFSSTFRKLFSKWFSRCLSNRSSHHPTEI